MFDPWRNDYYALFERETIVPRNHGLDSALFIMGSLDIGGGTNIILNHALALHQLGVQVTLCPLIGLVYPRWHPALEQIRVLDATAARKGEYDLAIATWWPTVYELPSFEARADLYFVQSIESRFGLVGDHGNGSYMADRTYDFDLPIVTVATWMQRYLSISKGRSATVVRNGLDKRWFSPLGSCVSHRDPTRLRLLVEGPLGVPMKGTEMALAAARDSQRGEVWLMTSSVGVEHAADRVLQQVPIWRVGDVYRSCDVMVKLPFVEGMFGPPLEMMHCGGTVVASAVTGYSEYLVDGENSVIVQVGNHDEAVDAIREITDNDGLRKSLVAGALATADAWPDATTTGLEFARIAALVCSERPRSETVMHSISRTAMV